MLVKTPVFRGERRLDEIVRQLLERNGVVDARPALADFVAVAIEKRDREIRFLQPVVATRFAERGHGEREHQDEPGGAERHALGCALDEQALYARDVEAIHESGEIVPARAQAHRGREEEMAEPRVEVEEPLPQAADLRHLQRHSGFLRFWVGQRSLGEERTQERISASLSAFVGRGEWQKLAR